MNQNPEYNQKQVDENLSKILNPDNKYKRDVKEMMEEIFR